MLAKEDWLEKHKHRFHQGPKDGSGNSSGNISGGSGGHNSQGGHGGQKFLPQEQGAGALRWRRLWRGEIDLRGHAEAKGALPQLQHLRALGARLQMPEERKKKKEAKQPEANVVIGGGEQGALMLAACDVGSVHGGSQMVHLIDKVIPVDGQKACGCSTRVPVII